MSNKRLDSKEAHLRQRRGNPACQTLALGRNADGYSPSVLGAVAGSSGLLVAALTVGPLRAFLNLASPTPLGWALMAGASLAAVPLNHLLGLPKLLAAAHPPPEKRVR